MTIRYFEFTDDKSSKFWQVNQNDLIMTVTYGKIGSIGTQKVKQFNDVDTLKKAIDKLISEKTKKGYTEIISNTQTSSQSSIIIENNEIPPSSIQVNLGNTVQFKPVLPEPTDFKNKASSTAVPPWFKHPEDVIFHKSIKLTVLPTRKKPAAAIKPNLKKSFDKVIKLFGSSFRYHINALSIDDKNTPERIELLENVLSRLKKAELEADFASDCVLYAFVASIAVYNSTKCNNDCIIEFLVAKGGLNYAIDVFLMAQTYQINLEYDAPTQRYPIHLSDDISEPLGQTYGIQYSFAELCLAQWLSHADEETFNQCKIKLTNALSTLHVSRQPLIALLFPDDTDLAHQIGRQLINNGRRGYFSTAWLSLVMTDKELLSEINDIKLINNNYNPSIQLLIIGTLFDRDGVSVVESIRTQVDYLSPLLRKILIAIGTPLALEIVANETNYDKSANAVIAEIIPTNPFAAIVAFTQLVLKDEASDFVKKNLEHLLTLHANEVPIIYPWVRDEVKQYLENTTAKYLKNHSPQKETLFASQSELPKLLVSPPWLDKKRKSVQAMVLQPLQIEDEIIDFDDSEIITFLNDTSIKRIIESAKTTKNILKSIGLRCNSVVENDPNTLFNKAVKFIDENNTDELIDALKLYTHNWDMDFYLPFTDALSDETVLAVIENCPNFIFKRFDYALYRFGARAINGIINYSKNKPSLTMNFWQYIASSKLAPIVAHAFVHQKSMKQNAMEWCIKFPEHCIIGLLPDAFGKKNESQKNAHTILRLLAQYGYAKLITEVASRYNDKKINDAVLNILHQDPLDLYPDKIQELPAFWQPMHWHRPRLNGTDKYLDDNALVHIGTMLQFPVTHDVYEGIKLIKSFLDPASLADFAWDVFQAWETASAPAKDNWAFKALGLLGNDETARKLTPLIRQWPGESLHQRATLGLDVLQIIGSDVSLMLLNGIAQKIKFKALQDKAKEKISEIADKRGLSLEELEDRLAPTLGLNDNGILELDFGPRQFTVCFDEALKPFVRDSDGRRLNDLPKPKQSDDEIKSKEAVDVFKTLKKDAKTIANQEIYRLEKAMSQRRRWDVNEFKQLLVKHPVVRHLVNKLVWGVYLTEENANYGGELVNCFRVAEDWSFTDALDELFLFPTNENKKIGIPHLLEIPVDVKVAFSQLFSDYEIIQPFKQLDREIYQLTEKELKTKRLTRFINTIIPTSRILGLKTKGWCQGEVHDSGVVYHFFKPIRDKFLCITFSEGIFLGGYDFSPEQKIEDVVICKRISYSILENECYDFSILHPIEVSESILELTNLAQK